MTVVIGLPIGIGIHIINMIVNNIFGVLWCLFMTLSVNLAIK
jgi:hypothetical protein